MTATPTCRSCGSRSWIVPSAVEVELTVTPNGIESVALTDEYPMDGEGDPRCVGCGELLLDWGSRTDDEAAWNAHHDERRPDWDLLVRELTPNLPMPLVCTWDDYGAPTTEFSRGDAAEPSPCTGASAMPRTVHLAFLAAAVYLAAVAVVLAADAWGTGAALTVVTVLVVGGIAGATITAALRDTAGPGELP